MEEYLPMGQNIEVEFSGVRLIWNKVTAQNLTLVWAETHSTFLLTTYQKI